MSTTPATHRGAAGVAKTAPAKQFADPQLKPPSRGPGVTHEGIGNPDLSAPHTALGSPNPLPPGAAGKGRLRSPPSGTAHSIEVRERCPAGVRDVTHNCSLGNADQGASTNSDLLAPALARRVGRWAAPATVARLPTPQPGPLSIAILISGTIGGIALTIGPFPFFAAAIAAVSGLALFAGRVTNC